jgi:hypothetical protein
MQWTNLANSKDAEIQASKARLTAFYPATFAPEVAAEMGDSEEKTGKLDMTIRPARAAASLR